MEYANCEKVKKSAIRPKKLEGEDVAEWLTVSSEPKYELVDEGYCDNCEYSNKCKEE